MTATQKTDRIRQAARAAAWDAGQESMIRNGRKRWSKSDYDMARRRYERLIALTEEQSVYEAFITEDSI